MRARAIRLQVTSLANSLAETIDAWVASLIKNHSRPTDGADSLPQYKQRAGLSSGSSISTCVSQGRREKGCQLVLGGRSTSTSSRAVDQSTICSHISLSLSLSPSMAPFDTLTLLLYHKTKPEPEPKPKPKPKPGTLTLIRSKRSSSSARAVASSAAAVLTICASIARLTLGL